MSQAFSFVPAVPGKPVPFAYGDVLADQIVSAISLGSIAVGERLPSEIELAGQFGVAVATLRKSLAILRDKGVVETRRGRGGGTFVVTSPFPATEQVREYLQRLTIVQIRDYGDEHAAVSTGIVRLACQRGHEDAIAELRRVSSRLERATTTSEQASADSRFHIQLAVIAQSQRLLRAEMRLQTEINALQWAPSGAALTVAEAVRDHDIIIEALAERNSARAESAVEDHITKTVYRLIDVKLTLDNLNG